MPNKIRIESGGAVRTVTLTRGDKRNALDGEMLNELEDAFSVTPPDAERLTCGEICAARRAIDSGCACLLHL